LAKLLPLRAKFLPRRSGIGREEIGIVGSIKKKKGVRKKRKGMYVCNLQIYINIQYHIQRIK